MQHCFYIMATCNFMYLYSFCIVTIYLYSFCMLHVCQPHLFLQGHHRIAIIVIRQRRQQSGCPATQLACKPLQTCQAEFGRLDFIMLPMHTGQSGKTRVHRPSHSISDQAPAIMSVQIGAGIHHANTSHQPTLQTNPVRRSRTAQPTTTAFSFLSMSEKNCQQHFPHV